MSKEFFVGLDIGTTRVKAVAVDEVLNLRGEFAVKTPWQHEANLAEIDLEALVTVALTAAVGAVSAAGGRARAIGITGLSETGALLDGTGRPMTPGLAWHDPRGKLDSIVNELGDETFRQTAGRPVTSVSSLAKILWLHEAYPKSKKARHFVSAPEWIIKALGGNLVNELSLVSRTGLFDVPKKQPWKQALDLIGAPVDFLGEIVGAGTSVGQVNGNVPSVLNGARLTVAGHDHQTASYFLGAAIDGALFDSMGTAEAMLRTLKGPIEPNAVARLASINVGTGWAVVPDHLTLLGGLPTGITLERIGKMVGALTPEARTDLGQRALVVDRTKTKAHITADYHGVTVHDLDDEVTPEVLWRIAVEDLIAFGKAMLATIETEVGPQSEVSIGGGWIHNPLIYEAKREQFGQFRLADVPEPGAMGAAELAAVCTGDVAPRWIN
jgi:sugar (pentulose or hexulose) kinase